MSKKNLQPETIDFAEVWNPSVNVSSMQDAALSHELEHLDYTKVAALQQKRMLAFINHFMLTNIQFMNNFLSGCEATLQNFERKLQKVEAAVIILETRLSSVPELETKEDIPPTATDEAESPEPSQNEEPHQSEAVEDPKPLSECPNEINPEYERFVKMVQVGVPVNAVKLKISLEGLDPSCFDKYLHK